ncbi:flavodoxin [Sedimentibacter sp.]|uniref:flavodoxin n=1 Tax=Sedimentibacter sp. TaxID=1960295 RepID=UPI0028981366|nr:flavodoxin [Sedimentibacter sp.]
MNKIAVVFWSGTGNTKSMAEHVAKGVKEAGAEVTIYSSAEFNMDALNQYDAVAFGCPSMGDEVLEESEFEPMFSECKPGLKGKKIALFGSYGWGDGEWMRNWEEDCRSLGAVLVIDSVICNETPDQDAQNACIDLGKALAS